MAEMMRCRHCVWPVSRPPARRAVGRLVGDPREYRLIEAVLEDVDACGPQFHDCSSCRL
jgi:hypothetical protein